MIRTPTSPHLKPTITTGSSGTLLRVLGFFLAIFLIAPETVAFAQQTRPNIVWIVAEDMSPHFGTYGETTISTPNVDRMAAEGVRFDAAIVTAPICSPSRSALVTGMYQTSIGAQHHRSGRGELKIHLPAPVQLTPKLFKDAGYLVLNVSPEDFNRSAEAVKANPKVKLDPKTDYNFEWDPKVYDRTHWAAREPGQPFFAQVQLEGGKLRGEGVGNEWPARVKKVLGSTTPASAVTLPPYLPDDPVIREDWAQYLDAVRYTDWEVGTIIDRLEEAGELENTYVFFLTDHGINHVRNKQFLYEGGIHIPLVARGPKIEPSTVREDVVQQIDLAATSLALAGLEVPGWMQARNLLATDYQPRSYAFSARDRADETVDRIRSVRGTRYKYIRNFLPKRPYLQPNAYKDSHPIIQAMHRLFKEGKLNGDQALIMAETRPAEELYDLRTDPYELHNLAGTPAHQSMLQEMQYALERWIDETGDQGRQPESAAMYDSDMAAFLDGRWNTERGRIIRNNIELMKRWAAEGR